MQLTMRGLYPKLGACSAMAQERDPLDDLRLCTLMDNDHSLRTVIGRLRGLYMVVMNWTNVSDHNNTMTKVLSCQPRVTVP